jgi:antagonist of KipI
MNTLRVHKPGMLTTVQDLGRPCFGPMGISPSGAADPVALRIGNRLVGNAENAAALEMTLIGGQFSFSEKTLVAVAGADFSATLRGEPIAPYSSVVVEENEVLSFGATAMGARCYLCVQHGIEIPELLGSRSTHLLSGTGGHEGRALRKDDVLPIGVSPVKKLLPTQRRPNLPQSISKPQGIIRVTQGPQWSEFTGKATAAFLSEKYTVSNLSDRTGIRLNGSPLELPVRTDILTEGVALGAIQIPRDGKPIILFVEQQTTGGYPKIANVIAADLHRLGQLRPRDEISFELVSFETAREELLNLEGALAALELESISR